MNEIRLCLILLLLVLVQLSDLTATAQEVPANKLPDGRQPYENSDAGMSLALQDFEAWCRAELARGNDISDSLEHMAGIAGASEVLSRNYAHIMEGLLPEIPDDEVVAEYTIDLSGLYY